MSPDGSEQGTPSDDERLNALLDDLKGDYDRWQDGKAVEMDGVRWTPDLVRDDGRRVLHVQRGDYVRGHVVRWMQAAQAADVEFQLALDLQHLYDERTLEEIAVHDPLVYVRDGRRPYKNPRLLAALSDERVTVSAETRVKLGEMGLEICARPGTADQRGRRLEALLGFLLSQIDDFVVTDRNFRTETEEIDIAVQQRATQGRTWATLGAPLVLVEAKNYAAPVSQEKVSAFFTKVLGKGGTAKIGLMVGANGFTDDATKQVLRLSLSDITLVLVGADELAAWASAEDPNDALEKIIRDAMLS